MSSTAPAARSSSFRTTSATDRSAIASTAPPSHVQTSAVPSSLPSASASLRALRPIAMTRGTASKTFFLKFFFEYLGACRRRTPRGLHRSQPNHVSSRSFRPLLASRRLPHRFRRNAVGMRRRHGSEKPTEGRRHGSENTAEGRRHGSENTTEGPRPIAVDAQESMEDLGRRRILAAAETQRLSGQRVEGL